ncbi:hypothetical protein [Aeromonas eucrenophila]|uniref:Lipase helper protein n=1 Tax=Aeromonas eucrenophila TaxID=649 RepID=A0ABW0YDZ2_9GAMM|nr:hypothetical protein [Aeromonas eucrenophila]
MRRRHGALALATVSLLLLYLIGQDEPAAASNASQASASPQQAALVPSKPAQADPPPLVVAASQTTVGDQPRSWRPLSEEAEERLASEIQESDQPLDERLENLRNVEGQWPSEGESLALLQGRYAEALAQLARDGEQLTLTERLAALTRLQDEWATQYPDLAADLFNPDARLLQARQLWGDEELETLTRHFLPSERADASLAFAGQRQQQLDQRARYQQQLAELEQQLAASQGAMDGDRWQQHREEVLGQWRRDFFAQEQAQH